MKWTIINEGSIGDRPSWPEFFMTLTIAYSSMSSCRKVRAGSIIVDGKYVVGMGYNGAPKQIPSCYDRGCEVEMKGFEYGRDLNTGSCVGIHAEKNALGHLISRSSKNLHLYTTIFPCKNCAKDLLPYEIDQITFKSIYSDKELDSALNILTRANVEINRLKLSPERFLDILFGFDLPFTRKFDVWSPEERERLEKKILR